MKILNCKADGDTYRRITPNGWVSFKINDFWKRKLTKRDFFFRHI